MLALEEMTEVTPAMRTVGGFIEILNGITLDETLDDDTTEELYSATAELFRRTLTELLRNRALLLWSDIDSVSVHILESSEECKPWIESAERLFEEYPIEDTEDPELDRFKRDNRFAREISFEQFKELAGSEFDNINNYSISETGLEYIFEDLAPIVNARAEGRI
ncbi:MAG: hypothetical protein HDT43_01815 [Ruminococcaceae bacterium]|nr:hypothetical protein [Oscillospiraceae bacterium]